MNRLQICQCKFIWRLGTWNSDSWVFIGFYFIFIWNIMKLLGILGHRVLCPNNFRPVGCRMYWLHLRRWVRPLPTSDLDITLYDLMGLWGMQSTPSLPLLPDPHKPGGVAPDRVLSMGYIELNSVLMLNWIVWNGIVFDIESVLTLNWIVLNRTVLTFNCM